MSTLPPLTYAKLRPPVTQTVIARERLFKQLHQLYHYPLTLVSAPAGWGKTTLLASWLEARQSSALWLSLSDYDNEPLRFLRYLCAMLQQVDPHIGHGLEALFAMLPPPDPQALLATLLNDLLALAEDFHTPLVIILDDVHVLSAAPLEQLLVYLVEHLPPKVHLVLLTRIDPALPLPRLRAQRRLLEIRAADLRFTTTELQAVSQSLGLGLAPAAVNLLHQRTEGWITGIQLATLALQSTAQQHDAFLADLTGTQRYIMDYLLDEVLDKQSSQLQHFLLQTSFLERLCGPLCDALLGRSDSQQVLQSLEAANVFVTALDDQRRWYRYHHLFRDLLYHRLQHTRPDLAELAQRAAAWYSTEWQRFHELAALEAALEHLSQVSLHAQAAQLLAEQFDQLWDSGAVGTVFTWLERLPASQLQPYPRLVVAAAWQAAVQGATQQAQSLLDQLQSDQQAGQAVVRNGDLQGRIAATQALIAVFQGAAALSKQWAEQALASLKKPSSVWWASATVTLGDALALQGDFAAAAERYKQVIQLAQVYPALNAAFKLASVQRVQGHLQQAYATCSAAIMRAEQSGMLQTALAGCLFALRGDILCEWNRLPEALDQTAQGYALRNQIVHQGFSGWITLYRLRSLVVAQQHKAATMLLQEAQTQLFPPWISAALAAWELLLAYQTGATQRIAQAISERLTVLPEPAQLATQATEYLMLAQILVAQQRWHSAETLLTMLDQLHIQQPSFRISILCGLVAVFHAHGEPEQARQALHTALTLAEPGGFVQPFVAGGGNIVQHYLQLISQNDPGWRYPQHLLAAFAPTEQPLIEPLSEREQAVLNLIAAGCSNKAIAEHLVISLNTVLYHTKNIYGKLGVSSRTQAVRVAREQQEQRT